MNNLTLKRATTKKYRFNITTNLNLADFTLYFLVKRSFDDKNEKALINKDVVIDPVAKTGLVELSATDTNLAKGDYQWGIRIHKDSDNSYALLQGLFKIENVVVGIDV